jgi:hypothetical protein
MFLGVQRGTSERLLEVDLKEDPQVPGVVPHYHHITPETGVCSHLAATVTGSTGE